MIGPSRNPIQSSSRLGLALNLEVLSPHREQPSAGPCHDIRTCLVNTTDYCRAFAANVGRMKEALWISEL